MSDPANTPDLRRNHIVRTLRPQAIRTISTPHDVIITLISSKAPPAKPQATQLDELQRLGLLKITRSGLKVETYTTSKILDDLALAGAISALAAYQSALSDDPPSYFRLTAINNAIKHLDTTDPANVLQGAFLDYQFHKELVATSKNASAITAYDKAIKPALWLHGAKFFEITDASHSVSEHERLITALQKRDALRARDAIAYHFEYAVQILRKGAIRKEFAYPITSESSAASSG